MAGTRPLQSPVIVGRDDVLRRFDRLLAEVAAGRGAAVLLAGAAGLGKTRLTRALARQATAAGFRVNGGSVAPQDIQVPLASIREMAAGMRGNMDFPGLSEDLLAIDAGPDGDALGARRMIVRAVADRILRAITQPTVLIFDDLHWTDEMSLEVIGELARHAAARPLLIVGDYRADELPTGSLHREWRARLLSQRHAEEIRLEPLTLEETATVTSLILGRPLPPPRDVVEAIHDRTNGIPLHIEELIAALDDETLADGRRIRAASVPDTIADAVLARLSRLSDGARVLARAGAVIGRCFSPDVIAGVLDQPLAALEPAIEELVGASIVYPFHYIDHGYYDFRHQLLRDAVYDSVSPAELRRFHAQAAEFVMTLEAASVVHASRHYERAGLRTQAYRASLAAAQDASRISARHEAYELFGRAVDNMPGELSVAEQADLLAQYAGAAAAIERNEDCVVAATRARALYLEAGRPLEAAEMLVLMAVDIARGDQPHAEMHAFTERALAEAEAQPETPERERLRAALIGMAASDALLRSDMALARRDGERARVLALAAGDQESALEADLLLARADIAAGSVRDGLERGLRAARAAREAGFESVGVTGYRNLAVAATRALDVASAERALEEGLQYADAIEQSHCRQMMATTRAMLDWGAGRWDEADARARQEAADRGCRRGMLGALDVIGLVALGRGQLDEARRWLDESLASGRRIGEPALIMTPLWGLAEVAFAAGDLDAAIAACDDALAVAEATGERALLVPFLQTATRSRIAARRPDDAERWLVRARALLVGWHVVAAAALDHAEGLLRLAAGAHVAAREHLERAVAGWRDRGRVWETCWAQLDLAHCLLRSNRYGDAAGVLGALAATADALGARPMADRADALARSVRGRTLEAEPWHPLTVREFEVARLIAQGMTNAGIGAEIGVSPRTVGSHVEHILGKLGATRRAEIATWVATVDTRESAAVGR